MEFVIRKKVASENTSLGLASYVYCPGRLQDCLMSNISGNNLLISLITCIEINIKGRKHLKPPLLLGCG